jgi:hypothetical protein
VTKVTSSLRHDGNSKLNSSINSSRGRSPQKSSQRSQQRSSFSNDSDAVEGNDYEDNDNSLDYGDSKLNSSTNSSRGRSPQKSSQRSQQRSSFSNDSNAVEGNDYEDNDTSLDYGDSKLNSSTNSSRGRSPQKS